MRRSWQYWLSCTVWGLGSTLLLALPVQAQVITSPVGLPTNAEGVMAELDQANVVYLGELHDDPDVHTAQLSYIQALFERDPDLAIGMEMFQRPFQAVLDDYIAGDLSELELLEQTEYEERWGFNWDFYAPILQFAQTHQIPVLALNTPQEITRKVATQGLSSLIGSDLDWIPSLEQITLEDPAYRQYLFEIYSSFHEGIGHSDGFNRFFEAQVLWDETMADRISTYLQANPDQSVVVLVGQGHVIYDYGIPSRVERNLDSQEQPLIQRTLILGANGLPEVSEPPLGDYIIEFQ